MKLTREAWWLFGSLGVILLFSQKDKIMPLTRPDADLKHLAPLFEVKIRLLLARMVARGFRPLVWETERSDERALELAKVGTGIVKTLHKLKPALAVDIVDAEKLWNNPAFYTALGEEALKLGLYRIKHKNPKTGLLTVDGPHVQAIPPMQQDKYFRASAAERNDMLQKLYTA